MRTWEFWNYPLAQWLLPNQSYKPSDKRAFFLGHTVCWVLNLLISFLISGPSQSPVLAASHEPSWGRYEA